MCFNQKGDISTLNGRSLKLVDKSTCLGSSVLSTVNDISTLLAKPLTAIDRLSVIRNRFSKQRSRQFYYIDATQRCELSVWRSLMIIALECSELYRINPGGNIPQNTSFTATYLLSRKPSKLDEQDMRDTAGEVRTNS